MRQFKWIDWNIQKIAAHGLSVSDVESSFDQVYLLQERNDDSFQMYAQTRSGRQIWVIWRYDREDADLPDVFGDINEPAIFVITAY
jgi:hypothetical protein